MPSRWFIPFRSLTSSSTNPNPSGSKLCVEVRYAKSLLPNLVEDECDADSVSRVAVALWTAGTSDVEQFLQGLKPEEHTILSTVCKLVARDLEQHVREAHEFVDTIHSNQSSAGSTRIRKTSCDGRSRADLSNGLSKTPSTNEGSPLKSVVPEELGTSTSIQSSQAHQKSSDKSQETLFSNVTKAIETSPAHNQTVKMLRVIESELLVMKRHLASSIEDLQLNMLQEFAQVTANISSERRSPRKRSSDRENDVKDSSDVARATGASSSASGSTQAPSSKPSASDREAYERSTSRRDAGEAEEEAPMKVKRSNTVAGAVREERRHSHEFQEKVAVTRRKSCIKPPSFELNLDDRRKTKSPAGMPTGCVRKTLNIDGSSISVSTYEHFENCPPTVHYSVAGYKIGEGTYGTVRVGRKKDTGCERAIKTIPKTRLHSQDALHDPWREIRLLLRLDHPNILRLFATYEDAKSLYLVTELCAGGELFEAIVEASSGLTERAAAKIMQQAIGAAWYLHSQSICHRDLKPENFLLSRKSDVENANLKLIDFGSAKDYAADGEMTTKVFTVHYAAPEILSRQMKPYSEKCDCWSLGVIFYLLLSGRPPFEGADDMAIMKSIKRGKYKLEPEALWENVSNDCKQLMTSMLEVNPEKRVSSYDALHHRWITLTAPEASGKILGDKTVVGGLRVFMAQNKLKKIALQVIAQAISDEHIDRLKSGFMAMDTDNSGSLEISEMEKAIQGLDIDEDAARDLKQILHEMAQASSGEVNYHQFLGATIDRRQYLQEEALKQAFNCFDADGDGQISKDELAAVLGVGELQAEDGYRPVASKKSVEHDLSTVGVLKKSESNAELEKILQDVDKDGDGGIDFQEFMEMMSRNA